MKITEVRAFPVGVALDEPLQWGAMKVEVKGGILVRVSTDEGVEGIGEAGFSAEYFPTVGPIINDQLGPMLVGRNPLDIAAIWQDMLNATHMWGRRGIETYAVSGIDIALWDILGKVAEQPVYRLLGAAKSRVKAYYAPSLKPTAEIVDESLAAVETGLPRHEAAQRPDHRRRGRHGGPGPARPSARTSTSWSTATWRSTGARR